MRIKAQFAGTLLELFEQTVSFGWPVVHFSSVHLHRHLFPIPLWEHIRHSSCSHVRSMHSSSLGETCTHHQVARRSWVQTRRVGARVRALGRTCEAEVQAHAHAHAHTDTLARVSPRTPSQITNMETSENDFSGLLRTGVFCGNLTETRHLPFNPDFGLWVPDF